MAALNELIQKIENPELRAQIQAAADKLVKQKKFGLVFEEHLPECRLRSLQWQTVVQHRTRKPQLVLTLYIQQLTLKSDIQ